MFSTVVGNFPKVGDSPEKQKLRRAFEAHQQGKISLEELERIEDEVTVEVIEEQVKAGIHLITDGQIRWVDPVTWPARKLRGISISGLIRFFDNNVYYRQPVVESAIGWDEPLLVRDFQFAKKAAPGSVSVKAVLPGPYTLARLSKNNHYSRFEELVMDFAKALAKEAKALESAGANFLQFDEPSIPYFPEDVNIAAKAFEICVAGLSGTMVALYAYFAGVSKVFPAILKFPAQIFGLDLVSDPENVKLVREKAFDKDLALGIVDARNTKMEKEEELQKLLQSFEKNQDKIKYVNPSCGLEFLPHDVAVRKLSLVGSLCLKKEKVI